MSDPDNIYVDSIPVTNNEFGGDATAESSEAAETIVEDRGDDFVPSEEGTDDTDTNTDPSDSAGSDTDTDTDTDSEVDGQGTEETDEPDEADDPDEEEAEEKPKPVKGQVPRDRLNKEIEKRKTLERQIRDLQNKAPEQASEQDSRERTPAAKPFTKEQFAAMQNAMLDGETEKGFEIFAEMMSNQSSQVRADAIAETDIRVRSELNIERENNSLSQEAQRQGERFPELVAGGDFADDGLIDEVVETRNIYIERGVDAAEALRKAVRIVSSEHGLVDRKSVAKAPSKKRVDVAGKIALAEKEQGKLGGGSTQKPAPVVDLAKISDSQFSKLSEDAKARARGDYL